MRRFRCGLVVGKFCPLHLGHELLIGRALEFCDEVLVISYTKPEFPKCEPGIREGWLNTRFPETTTLVLDDDRLADACAQRGLARRRLPANNAPDDEQRGFVAWICTELLQRHPDAVFTSEDYGDGLAAALSAAFRSLNQRAPAVEHVSVDAGRVAVPVSGTAIRGNPHGHRQFLAPAVYAAFVERVCILGGESSGKTTFAEKLAERLNTEWVPEFGRELWEQRGGSLRYEDMLHIARTQAEREDRAALRARRWLICDTSPLTTLFYSGAMFGRSETELTTLAGRPYGHIFLCAPDFPFVQDGTRQRPHFRDEQHQWHLSQLQTRGWPFMLLTGRLSERLEMAMRQLDR